MKSKTNRGRAFFFNIGLALSLGVTLFAFEWQSGEVVSTVNWQVMETPFEEPIDIPITETIPPPPPKTPTITVIEDDSKEQDDDLEDIFDEPEPDEKVEVYEPVIEDEPDEPEPVSNQPFIFLENSAKQPDNFYKYMKKNIKYPRQARRMGIEGKVFLSFVVNEDGSISDIQVVKGIGAGCDEEAVRILKGSPKWSPGKQRGIAVKQKLTFPVRFTLGRRR